MTKYSKISAILLFSFVFSHFFLISEPIFCFRIYLTDKNNSPYSIYKPEEFLSQRAIDKRERFNIAITEEDFPVNPNYISQIANTDPAIRVWTTSKWTNTLTILCKDTTSLPTIRNLDFVQSVQPVGYYDFNLNKNVPQPDKKDFVSPSRDSEPDTSYYGPAYPQIAIHNGHYLHNEGFKGKGMLIAVLDGGWTGCNTSENMANLYSNNRISGEYEIIPYTEKIYNGTTHGTACTSIIGAALPYQMVGTAPEADFIFIRSEDPRCEIIIEEDYWARGAELADSLGADVISSSLGYTQFDNDSTITYSSCDGESSIASIAATKAAHKGIIVCIAAGNDGAKEWHKISRPSDAKDILCVGAVNKDSVYAYFSSCGPSFDGRVKPDVAACGWNTFVVNHEDSIKPGNGTSYATPVISGLAACLWQALPQYNSLEIMQFIRESGHQFTAPDTLLGYGIPDFYKAWLEHHNAGIKEVKNSNRFFAYPNPAQKTIFISNPEENPIRYEVFDITGKMVKREDNFSKNSIQTIDIQDFKSGVYLLLVIMENGRYEALRIVKE